LLLIFVACRLQGKPGSSISVDEEAMTATVAAGVTQRTLLRFLDNYRFVLL
jgi:FAD/FMN-containing dehydrogenase